MMQLLLFLLFRGITYVNGVQCCSISNQVKELKFDSNLEQIWNAEFSSDYLNLEKEQRLFTLSDGEQFVEFQILQSQIGYDCYIQDDEGYQLYILGLEMGNFNQIFMKLQSDGVELYWYKDFEIYYQRLFSFKNNENVAIKNIFEFSCWQLISFKNIQKYLENCETSFHVTIKTGPLLDLAYLNINNNFYLIQFWVKIVEQSEFHLGLIGMYDELDIMFRFGSSYIYINKVEQFLHQQQNGWNYIQLGYQRINQIFKYQNNNFEIKIKIEQQFLFLSIFCNYYQNVLPQLTIHLRQTNFTILCPPGCLICESKEYCIKCNNSLLLLNGFCECQESFNFIISQIECYNQIDYEISEIEKSTNRNNCPTYDGQECSQCQNQLEGENFQYCLYVSDISLKYQIFERDLNFYYLVVYYERDKEYYDMKDCPKDAYKFIFILNTIIMKKNFYDIYKIGYLQDYQNVCQQQYSIFFSSCKQNTKMCHIQPNQKQCQVCIGLYFQINGKCKRCPNKCEYCQIINKQMICLKCKTPYFLNFQRSCILCELKYCESCYHYQGQLYTLGGYFKIQKKDFQYNLGCSYCQDSVYLDVTQRICKTQIDSDDDEGIAFQNKTYLLKKQQDYPFRRCSNNCELCIDQCLYCKSGYYLHLQSNYCIRILSEQYDVYIYNQNQDVHDSDFVFSLIPFIQYSYNFSQIRLNQNSYYIKNCELIDRTIRDFDCQKTNPLKLSRNCKFYCNICYKNQKCADLKYKIVLKLNYTLIKEFNQIVNHNNYNYIFYINKTNLQFKIQFKITLDISELHDFELSGYLSQFDFAFNHPMVVEMPKIILNNEIFNLDIQNQIIQNSNIFVLDKLCFLQDHMKFSMLNVSIKGLGQNKALLFIRKQLLNFNLSSVDISNIKYVLIEINSTEIYIKNVFLSNLTIRNHLFKFTSNNIVIENLVIQDCLFHDVSIFVLQSKRLQFQNIYLLNVSLKNSTIFTTGKGQQLFYLKNFILNYTINQQSTLVRVQGDNEMISLIGILILKSYFNQSILISQEVLPFEAPQYAKVRQNQILSNISITQCEFQSSKILIFSENVLIENFIMESSKIFGEFIIIHTFVTSILNMQFLNCKFNLVGVLQQYLVSINSMQINIDQVYFSNIQSSVTFLRLYKFKNANIANVQIQQIQIDFNLKQVFHLGDDKSQSLVMTKTLVKDFNYFDKQYFQDTSLFFMQCQQIVMYQTELFYVNANYRKISQINTQQIDVFYFIAHLVNSYDMFDITAVNIKCFNLNFDQTEVQNNLFKFLLFNLGNIELNCLSISKSIIMNNVIIVNGQEIEFIKIRDLQLKISRSGQVLTTSGYLIKQTIIQEVKIRNSQFYNSKDQQQFKVESQFLSIESLLIFKAEQLSLQFYYRKLTIFQFSISHSFINYLHFDQQNLTEESIRVNQIYLHNNKIGTFRLISYLTRRQALCFNGLNIINNTIKQDQYLLQLNGNMYIQINMYINRCGYFCVFIQNRSKITFDQSIYDNQYTKQILDIEDKSVRTNFKGLEVRVVQIAININNKYIIGNGSMIYLPSGQQLIKYQTYQNGRLIHYFQQIQLIKYQQNKNTIINGQFKITVLEYNLDSQQSVRDLSQFCSFNEFEQSNTYFGLDYFSISFNPYQNDILQIQIQQIGDEKQTLIFYARTQICQRGEILFQSQCLVCDSKLQVYSVRQKSNFCQSVDQISISDHQQGSIKLRQGYWRPFFYSSQIEYCYNKQSNCQGGWHTGDESCGMGHIGGICSACDLYNTRGHGYFQQEDGACKLCGQFDYYKAILKIVFVIFILCLKLYLQLEANIQNYKKFILQRQVYYGHFHILVNYIIDQPTIIFNITIANFAYLQVILQDQINLPNIITIFSNPIILERNSSTCLQLILNVELQYWINIFKVILPLFTYNIFIILMIITSCHKNLIKNIFIFPIIQLFITQGPTLIVLFIQQALYINLSNIRYASFDSSIRYFSNKHQINLQFIVVPFILLFTLVLPFIIFSIMKRINKNLSKGSSFITGGNYLLTYKHYYQEILNYFRNAILLTLFIQNDKLILFQLKALTYILLIYIENLGVVHRYIKIQYYSRNQGKSLVFLLVISNYIEQMVIPKQKILFILYSSFIIESIYFQLTALVKQEKQKIHNYFLKKEKMFIYLGLKKYLTFPKGWKVIKQNYMYQIKQRICKSNNTYQFGQINTIIHLQRQIQNSFKQQNIEMNEY